MAALRRTMLSMVPTCDAMEARLALSGNFLSHGLADVSREVKHLEHHQHAEHSTVSDATSHQKKLLVHYHHIVDHAVAPTK